MRKTGLLRFARNDGKTLWPLSRSAVATPVRQQRSLLFAKKRARASVCSDCSGRFPLSCAAGSARRYASVESSLRPDTAFPGTRSKYPSGQTISGEAARGARHDGSTSPPSSLQSRGHLCKVAQHGRRLSLSAAALQVGGTRANYRNTLSQISRKTFGEALMVQIRFSASTGACPTGAWLSARFLLRPLNAGPRNYRNGLDPAARG